MEDYTKMIVEAQQQKIKDLEARSKSLQDLVVSEVFTVDRIISGSYATSFTPHSEIVIGGKCPVYKGGLITRLVLEVTPENKGLPVRTLRFYGTSAVRAGDRVLAKIPRYREEAVANICNRQHNIYRDSRVFYLDRGFNAEESPIELAIISESGRVLREDRAVNYEEFVEAVNYEDFVEEE